MKKKIIAIGMIGIFLLISLASINAIGKKTIEEINEPGTDLAVEICPLIGDNGKQNGLYVKVKNVGTEIVKGSIFGILKVYRGFNKLIPMIGYWWPLKVLEEEQELEPGEVLDTTNFWASFFKPPVHLNYFAFQLKFDDENLDNNVCEQTALSIHIPFLFYRMYFI